MSYHNISVFLQAVVATGLLNVWLIRARRPTNYRGGEAKNILEEFAAYGLPTWVCYSVGFLKISSALVLLAGIWVPGLAAPAAGLVAALMVGAVAMHLKVKDPILKSVPALLMLAMCLGISILSFT